MYTCMCVFIITIKVNEVQQTPRTVAIKCILLNVNLYIIVHFVRRNEIIIVFLINTLHL